MKIKSNISGIYKILNLRSSKFYIGSAVDIKRRWAQHKHRLLKNNHDNTHLQSAFNLYGLEGFEWSIVEIVEDINILLNREQYWLDYYKSYDREIGYNSLKIAGSNWKKFVSDESRLKMKNSKLGSIRREDTHNKILDSMKKEVYQIDKKTLKVLNKFESLKQAGEATGIFPQLISGVCRRRTKSAKGFYWSFSPDNFIPLDKYHNTPEKIRYIVCPNSNRRWRTLSAASKDLGITKNQIYSKIKWEELKYEYEQRI